MSEPHAPLPDTAPPATPPPPLLGPPTPTKPGNPVGLAIFIGVGIFMLICVSTVLGSVILEFLGDGDSGRNPVTVTAAPTASAYVPNAAGRDHSGDLPALLLAKPAGAKSWREKGVTGESLTAQQEADTWAKPDLISDMLQRHEFVTSAARCWSQQNERDVCIHLLKFTSVVHAGAFYEDLTGRQRKDAESNRLGVWPNVPGGVWEVLPEPTEGSVASMAYAQRGDVMFYVVVWEPEPAKDGFKIAQQVGESQYVIL